MRKLFFAFVLSLGMTSVSFATETESKTTETTPVETKTVKKIKKTEDCVGFYIPCIDYTGLYCSGASADKITNSIVNMIDRIC